MARKEKLKWWNMLMQRLDGKGTPNWDLAEQTATKQKEKRVRQQFANAREKVSR